MSSFDEKSVGESRTELVGSEGFLMRKKEGGGINVRGTLRYRNQECGDELEGI